MDIKSLVMRNPQIKQLMQSNINPKDYVMQLIRQGKINPTQLINQANNMGVKIPQNILNDINSSNSNASLPIRRF